jgi:hypothetical protein
MSQSPLLRIQHYRPLFPQQLFPLIDNIPRSRYDFLEFRKFEIYEFQEPFKLTDACDIDLFLAFEHSQ